MFLFKVNPLNQLSLRCVPVVMTSTLPYPPHSCTYTLDTVTTLRATALGHWDTALSIGLVCRVHLLCACQ